MMNKDKRTCPGCGVSNNARERLCMVCGGNMAASFFDVLGLTTDANLEAIHKAYRKAAARCHPDKTAHLSAELQKLAEHKMQQLNHIWDVLKIPEKRASYIRSLQYPPTQDRTEQSDNTPEHEPSDTEPALCRADPVRRGLARTIDYLLISLILFALIRLLVPPLLQWGQTDLLLGRELILVLFGLVFISISTFLWVWLEAFFIAQFATTPGKWLMRIRVVDAQQDSLNGAAALERALSVWFKGMAGGFLPLAPLAWIYWYRTAGKGETLPWDHIAQSEAVVEQSSIFAYAASAIILLQGAGLLYLNWQELTLGTVKSTRPISTTPVQSKPIAKLTTPAPTAPVATVPAKTQPTPVIQPNTAAVAQPKAAVPEPTSAPTTAHLENTHTDTSKTEPEAPNHTPRSEPILPPPMRIQPAATASIKEPFPAPVPTVKISAQKNRKISEEQRVACMNRYFEIMHQATELPLGDYVRIDREARVELDRCLR